MIQWDETYKNKFNSTIKNALPSNFVDLYNKSNWFHDWYLKNFYIANTGKDIQVYSKKGSSSFQIELCTGGNNHILLTYINVKKLDVNFSETNDTQPFAFTGFGVCLTNIFDINADGSLTHAYVFEGDNTISIQFEKIKYKKIRYDFW